MKVELGVADDSSRAATFVNLRDKPFGVVCNENVAVAVYGDTVGVTQQSAADRLNEIPVFIKLSDVFMAAGRVHDKNIAVVVYSDSRRSSQLTVCR